MNRIQTAVKQCFTIIGPTFVEIDESLLHETIEKIQRQGLLVIQIDTNPVKSFDDLFNAFYEKCSFPEWFGFNEAALKDMLLDLHWLPAKGYVFVFANIHTMEDLPLRMFVKHFTLAHQIKEEKSQIPLKFLLPSDLRNEKLQSIVDLTLKSYFSNKAKQLLHKPNIKILPNVQVKEEQGHPNREEDDREVIPNGKD